MILCDVVISILSLFNLLAFQLFFQNFGIFRTAILPSSSDMTNFLEKNGPGIIDQPKCRCRTTKDTFVIILCKEFLC